MNRKLRILSRQMLRQRCAFNSIRSVSTTLPILISHKHHVSPHPLVYRTIGQELELSVAKYGDVEAIVSCHERKRYTFKELLREADALAAGFRKLGLQRGDAIGLWAPNFMHWYLGMMGAARAGLTSVGLNPAYQGPEMAYCLNKPGKIRSEKFPHLKSVIIESRDALKGALRFDEFQNLANQTEREEVAKIQKDILPESACNIQFTSGTTGNPKAAVLSHYSFVNNGIHVANRNQLEGERICVQVPLFHAFGVCITIMAGLSKGATMVMPAAGFSPNDSLQAIVNEKCTVIHGTPTMYVDLVSTQKKLQMPLGRIKKAVTGGAIVSPQLIKDVRNVLGVEAVHSVYGLTESTAVIFQSLPGDDSEIVLNSVGHLQDHIEAKVVDAQGRCVPFGQPGELCVRGYTTMIGYHGDEAKTKETIKNMWLHTGDQFILEENGYGRIVIGVPDERLGEEVCAYVRLEEGVDPASFTEETLKEYSKGKLAHFKVPRYVIPIDAFPKTTSGKVQKFKLVEAFKEKETTELKAVSA
ncbi:hypothetical protein M5D96_003370 [Drosophila gunungcola]|uniref:Medium-chain acyl-CoA ligase ACSF2, mitochondrial n=1 Tax=Drosophila gunungcola TaxID=103775 RepID=A0A9P9YRZ0_9MUSC|nr:hypothetical protein M5D96_003370 [Drosophila gunungcola]